MKYCNSCNLKINTSSNKCPKCNFLLEDANQDSLYETYPKYHKKRMNRTVSLFLVIICFVTVITTILNIITYQLGYHKIWAIAAVGIIPYIWYIVQGNIFGIADTPIKIITNAFLLAIYVYIFDINLLYNGVYYISIDLLFPAIIVGALFSLFVCSFTNEKHIVGSIAPCWILLLSNGVLMWYIYASKMNSLIYPMWVSLFISLGICFLYLIIYYHVFLEELKKRFHL